MTALEGLLGNLGLCIAQRAKLLLFSWSKKTLTAREIQSAVRLVFPGELKKHAVSQGQLAVAKFTQPYSLGGEV